jgi:hypothetical protein
MDRERRAGRPDVSIGRPAQLDARRAHQLQADGIGLIK